MVADAKTKLFKFSLVAEKQWSATGTGCGESVQGSPVRDREKNQKDMSWIWREKLTLYQRQEERGILGNDISKWEEMDINSVMCWMRFSVARVCWGGRKWGCQIMKASWKQACSMFGQISLEADKRDVLKQLFLTS